MTADSKLMEALYSNIETPEDHHQHVLGADVSEDHVVVGASVSEDKPLCRLSFSSQDFLDKHRKNHYETEDTNETDSSDKMVVVKTDIAEMIDKVDRTKSDNHDGVSDNHNGVSDNHDEVSDSQDGVSDSQDGVSDSQDGVSDNRDEVSDSKIATSPDKGANKIELLGKVSGERIGYELENYYGKGRSNARTGEKSFMCDFCSKTFPYVHRLDQHRRIHTGEKPFVCKQCDRCFTQQGDLIKHMRTHTGEKPFKCGLCVKAFSQQHHLTRHYKTHPEEEVSLLKSQMEADKLKKKESTGKNLQDDNDENLDQLFLISSGALENSKGQTKKKKERKPKKKYEFPCLECGKVLGDSANFKVHQRRHRGEEPFFCDECPRRFVSRQLLRKHKQVHVVNKTYLPCDQCDKKFTTKQNLSNHKKFHADERPFKCTVCDKSFVTSVHLDRHLTTHSEEKPFACIACDKSFRSEDYLKEHQKIHSAVKTKKCKECGSMFLRNTELNKHMRMHTGEKPYSCSQCDKTFSSKSSLIHHERIHAGIKPYSCGECKKQFYSRSEVRSHQLIRAPQAGPKRKCKDCGQMFYNSCGLTKHQNTDSVHACKMCNEKLQSNCHLSIHIASHKDNTGIGYVNCGEDENVETVKQEIKSETVEITEVGDVTFAPDLQQLDDGQVQNNSDEDDDGEGHVVTVSQEDNYEDTIIKLEQEVEEDGCTVDQKVPFFL